MQDTKRTPIHLNLLDRLWMAVSPSHGRSRIQNKMAVSFLSDQGYVVAGSNKRSMRGWNPSANSADVDTIPKLDAMRAGSRDMYMNTPLGRAPLNRCKTNAIGSGLRLQSRIDRETLGLNADKASAWEKLTEKEFNLWASSIECDASRTQNFYDLTSTAFLSVLMSGDVFAAFPFIERKGMPYDLRIKLIEADMCSNPYTLPDSNSIAGGVEIDDNGAPLKYHFSRNTNRWGMNYGPMANTEWTSIPAYNSSGMKQLLHLFFKERPGQRRGIPFIAPITETLKQLTRYSKAEIDAAIINSYFTVFVKHLSDNGGMKDGYIPPTYGLPIGSPGVAIPNDDDRDDVQYEMGSGNVIDMMTDEDITLADPKHPVAGFPAFLEANLKQIGASLEIPFEVLVMHFSSSYSAARAALNEAWKFFMTQRTFMVRYWCEPCYEWWMIEAILKGRIVAPGFFEDALIRKAWLGSAWVGPGRGMIEPSREIRAAKNAITARLSTYEDEHRKLYGEDWDKAMDRLEREEKTLMEKGLTNRVDEDGAVVPTAETEEEETEGRVNSSSGGSD